MTNFEIPQPPTEIELLQLTAEEYLRAIGEDADAVADARKDYVENPDLIRMIDTQVAAIEDLTDLNRENPAHLMDVEIIQAHIELGKMLVDNSGLVSI